MPITIEIEIEMGQSNVGRRDRIDDSVKAADPVIDKNLQCAPLVPHHEVIAAIGIPVDHPQTADGLDLTAVDSISNRTLGVWITTEVEASGGPLA